MPLSVPRSGTLLQKLNRSAVPHLLVTLWVGGRWEGRVGRCLCSLGCALGRACALGGVGCSVSRLATKTQKPGSAAGWGGGLRDETPPGGVSGGGADNAAAHSADCARRRM